VAWEYRENAVSVGAMYKSVVEVKDAVKRWSTLTLQREFRVVKSSPHIYDVQCLKPNYTFRVYASKGKWKKYWEIKSIVDHTCVLEQLDESHHNLSSGFVASQMFAKIVENPTFVHKSIILTIEEKFRYHISYGKAYMAKKKVVEMRWGTFTQDLKDSALYIPNPDLAMCQGVGRRKKKMITNNMDEAEAGPQGQICSKCNNPGHSYKKCTEASYFSTSTSTPPATSARGCRCNRYNEGMQ
jgi:hypothetical protein